MRPQRAPFKPWSRQKWEAHRALRAWSKEKHHCTAQRSHAVGGAELLRWHEQGFELELPELTSEALAAAGITTLLEKATPPVRRAALRFLLTVVKCWSDGGRAFSASRPKLARLFGWSERTAADLIAMFMGVGVLVVDADFIDRAKGPYRRSRQPNIYAPGLLLIGAARASGLERLPSASASQHGAIAWLRARVDGVRNAPAPRAVPKTRLRAGAARLEEHPPLELIARHSDPDLPREAVLEIRIPGNVETPVDNRADHGEGVACGDEDQGIQVSAAHRVTTLASSAQKANAIESGSVAGGFEGSGSAVAKAEETPTSSGAEIAGSTEQALPAGSPLPSRRATTAAPSTPGFRGAADPELEAAIREAGRADNPSALRELLRRRLWGPS